jgi:uncharacterized lipoprotein YmbA
MNAALLIATVAALLAAGCSSTAQKSYFLEPDGPAPGGSGMLLGVGPIRIPDYLQRREIAIETAPHELDYAYDHLWAGGLEQQISTALGQNLGRRLGTGSIHAYPWDSQTPVDYQVSVDIRRFHASEGGRAVLEAGWRIYDLKAKRIITSRSSTLEEALQGDGYGAATAAQSRLISRLSTEIAAALRGH